MTPAEVAATAACSCGHPPGRFYDEQAHATCVQDAQAALTAALLGDWLVEAIHRGVCEDSPEECRSEGRGACVRGAAAIREAGIQRA